jgi:ABC-type bacteriocin/lantibiotic exporter with double-glycine peptidase domain
MEQLMHGRTCFLITHRLNPLSACDMMLVLERGELVAVTPEGQLPGVPCPPVG